MSCDRMQKAGHTEVAAGIFRVAAKEPPAGKFDTFPIVRYFGEILFLRSSHRVGITLVLMQVH